MFIAICVLRNANQEIINNGICAGTGADVYADCKTAGRNSYPPMAI